MTNGKCEHETCAALFEKMSDYIDRELDETDRRELERHTSECFACRVCLETLKRTVALCNGLEPSPVPHSLVERLRIAVGSVRAGQDPPRCNGS